MTPVMIAPPTTSVRRDRSASHGRHDAGSRTGALGWHASHPPGLDDTELLALWADSQAPRGRRERAFRQLVEHHRNRVFGLCLRELGSALDAEEATQDTFAKVARAATGFRGDSCVSTWMYRIAINTCRDIQRRQAVRPERPVADISIFESTPDGHEYGPEHVQGVETAAAIRHAMDRLDGLSRTLVILCLIQGTTCQEASQIMDMPVGTVKSRIHRARASMAAILAAND